MVIEEWKGHKVTPEKLISTTRHSRIVFLAEIEACCALN
jgi:hypothetical protein